MDPDANIREQIELARHMIDQFDAADEDNPTLGIDPHDADRLAELVLALAEWRARGGFDPDWKKAWER